MSEELLTRAVLSDMDGTLVDSTVVVEQAWATFSDRFGLPLPEVLDFAHGRKTRETVAEFLPSGFDIAGICHELDSAEVLLMDGIVPIFGASDFVASFDSSSFALVTSAPRELAARRMAAAGVPMPEVVVAAEDVTEGKPMPQGYLKAAAELGVSARDTIVFEDAEPGVAAGLAAGARVVVVGELEHPITQGLPRIADFAGITVDRRPTSSGHPAEYCVTIA